MVFNKADLIEHPSHGSHAFDAIEVSALRREGLGRLLAAIARSFSSLREEIDVKLPLIRGDLIALARRDGEILSEEYADGVVSMRALVSASMAGRLRKAALSAA
jgi:50S ribosomal subunit-associated GTPase HflX